MTNILNNAARYTLRERDFPPCRILVVDDNVDAADSLSLLLSMCGHEVLTSRDGLTGIQEMRAFQPDVVILDLGTPGMDGSEVAKQAWKLLGRDRVN